VIELKHLDPSVNQNSRAPVAMKLRTQKDGCLQTKESATSTTASIVSKEDFHDEASHLGNTRQLSCKVTLF
jgi:hypothetical protein